MKKYIALAFVFFATQQTQGMEGDITQGIENITRWIENMYLTPVESMRVEDQGENNFYNNKKNELNDIIEYNNKVISDQYNFEKHIEYMCFLLNNFKNSLHYNLNENNLKSLFEISRDHHQNFMKILNIIENSNKFYNDQDYKIKYLNYRLVDSDDLTDKEYYKLYKKIESEFRTIMLSIVKSKDHAPGNRLGVLSADIKVILKAYHPDNRHETYV